MQIKQNMRWKSELEKTRHTKIYECYIILPKR